jgi:hypothetical protein
MISRRHDPPSDLPQRGQAILKKEAMAKESRRTLMLVIQTTIVAWLNSFVPFRQPAAKSGDLPLAWC